MLPLLVVLSNDGRRVRNKGRRRETKIAIVVLMSVASRIWLKAGNYSFGDEA